MAALVEESLSEHGTDTADSRGQCYENGVNIAAKVTGVHAHIKSKNSLAIFFVCVSHIKSSWSPCSSGLPRNRRLLGLYQSTTHYSV